MRTTHGDRPDAVAAVVVAVVAAPSSLSLPPPPPLPSSSSSSPSPRYRRRRFTLGRGREGGGERDALRSPRRITQCEPQAPAATSEEKWRPLSSAQGTTSSFTAARTLLSFCHAPLVTLPPPTPLFPIT